MDRRKNVSFLLLFLSMLLMISCSNTPGNRSQLGNSNGNIVNGGLSVKVDEGIYFTNIADNYALYRHPLGGSAGEKISEDQALYLNSYDGWLYYSNASDANKLYRMKPDGKERTQLTEDAAANVIVADGWVYYIRFVEAQPGEPSRSLYKMKLDGSEQQAVVEKEITFFNVQGNQLYYLLGEGGLYQANLDGTEAKLISDTQISNFIVQGGYIYYAHNEKETREEDEGTYETEYATLWRMKKDGTDHKKLSEGIIAAFNMDENFIYFSSGKGDDLQMELKKMKLDGSDVTNINSESAVAIGLHGEWLSYLSFEFSTFEMKMVLMKNDGSERADYVYEQIIPERDIPISKVGERVETDELALTGLSMYVTNIVKNSQVDDPSPIFDMVSSGAYVFMNVEVTNKTEEPLELSESLGIIEDITVPWPSIYGMTFAEINVSGQEEVKDITFHLPRESYVSEMVLEPGETKTLQLYVELYEYSYPLHLAVVKSGTFDPIAAIAFNPDTEYFVVSWEKAMERMTELFPDAEINQLNGLGYRFSEAEPEKMYYTFKVKMADSQDYAYCFIERDSGDIYVGGYDAAYPDYEAVPKELWQQ